ncbi:hypothetical protein [Flavobacterium sp. 140616W15]|uniref:hypothetical protein n=1 Tax=Flavobacterium sp. 140616W15 TaxID=2478552 RepID=UPI000F0CB58D|nr:hypothetical protein [Flavobacterium sp. 140616W15]AYN04406.1 hypothetical protein EAG11_09605 [Flavobacterium sp. 140616W15]
MEEYLLMTKICYKQNGKSKLLKNTNLSVEKIKEDILEYFDLGHCSIELMFRKKYYGDGKNVLLYIPENEISISSLNIKFCFGIFLMTCLDSNGELYSFINKSSVDNLKEYFIQDEIYYEEELCFDINVVIEIAIDFVLNKRINLNYFETVFS